MSAPATLERLELVNMCERLGYNESLREEDFPVWQENLVAEVACFAAPERKDMATATLVAGVVFGDIQRARHFAVARALAAPICLLRANAAWQIYSVRADREIKLLSDGPPPDESPALSRFMAPEALLAAKNEPQQLSLLEVDVGLLGSAREAAGRDLDRRVRHAIAGLLGSEPDQQAAENAARLIVRALTALAARDKLTADRSLDSAIARVEELSPGHLGSIDRNQLSLVAEELGHGLNFRTLDPALLGDVYERAVLIPAKRLSLGAYYTPPEIARHILGHLPIEEVEPAERRFLDPSCGSGTLLLAANDRLMSSLADETDDRSRHDYALERLVGSDNDPFAVELARLALFLQALPYGNGYCVEQRDALVETPSESKATFSVSNPPWRYNRRDGEREQLADGFLRRLVERTEPGGFVACVLPASWLTADTSRESRAWLREHADIFEIWRLPTRIFRTSTMAPSVVFAQVGGQSSSTYRYCNVWSSGRDRFRSHGVSDETSLATLGDPHGSLTASWLTKVPALRDAKRLDSVATIRDGAPVQNIRRLDESGPHPFLRAYGQVVPFGTVTREITTSCRYPHDFSKRGSDASPRLYLMPKVLVSAMASVDEPWRLRAFLDPLGVIPRNSMYAVIPHTASIEARLALLGLLSSAVASLCVAQEGATRMANSRSIAALPVPPTHTWSSIAAVTKRVVVAQAAGEPLDGAVRELDALIFDAFSLSASTVTKIGEALAGQRAPEGTVRFDRAADPPREASLLGPVRAGAVLDVRENRVRLDVPGLTDPDGIWVSAPDGLLGWTARAGRTFDVVGSDRGLREAKFRFQPDSWRSLSELLADFG